MVRQYITLAVVALLAYSIFPVLVNIAVREIPASVIVFIASVLLGSAALGLSLLQDEAVLSYLTDPYAAYVYVAGLFLTVGILSYYRALASGPVSVVTPIFGMFLVGTSVLSVVFLEESLTPQQVAGIGLAVIAVYSVATG